MRLGFVTLRTKGVYRILRSQEDLKYVTSTSVSNQYMGIWRSFDGPKDYKHISDLTGYDDCFCFSRIVGKVAFSFLSDSLSHTHTQMLCLVFAQSL